MRTVSAGSHLSCTEVSAGSKSSWTVSAEAKYDVQSMQEAKIGGINYTLWSCCGSNMVLLLWHACPNPNHFTAKNLLGK